MPCVCVCVGGGPTPLLFDPGLDSSPPGTIRHTLPGPGYAVGIPTRQLTVKPLPGPLYTGGIANASTES